MIELIQFVADELGHPINQEDAQSILEDFNKETKKQKLERLIRDEMNTIEILRDKKKDIERQIDLTADRVSKMRDELNAL